jgi:hypothetical protein
LLRRLPERVFAAAGIAVFATGAALRGLPYDAVALVCSGATGLGLPCVLIAAMTAVRREAPAAWVPYGGDREHAAVRTERGGAGGRCGPGGGG